MTRNICAFTASGSNAPDYLSLNEKDNGQVILTTRHGGVVHELAIPSEQLNGLYNQIGQYLLEKEQLAHVADSPIHHPV
jgi:hypothetical protein